MAKLRKIVGEDRLEMIRIEKPELYGQLMDYIDGHRAITTRMCKQLLEEYNLNFDVDHDVAFHKQLRAKAEEFGSDGGDDDSYFRNSASVTKTGPLHEMNKTHNSDNLINHGAGKNANRMGGSLQPKKEGKKNNMFQFVEWNF
jgi:hypothetical protein